MASWPTSNQLLGWFGNVWAMKDISCWGSSSWREKLMYTQSQEPTEPLNGMLDICWSEASPCSHWPVWHVKIGTWHDETHFCNNPCIAGDLIGRLYDGAVIGEIAAARLDLTFFFRSGSCLREICMHLTLWFDLVYHSQRPHDVEAVMDAGWW